MNDVVQVTAGNNVLIVSIPHDGRELPADIAGTMTETGRKREDNDWYVADLSGFAKDFGAAIVRANFSRYVIDLNRPADDQVLYPGQAHTGLCPKETFSGAPIYQSGEAPTAEEIERRIEGYWHPYHRTLADTIENTRRRFSRAVLWDAHSIARRVPKLFSGPLPDLNVGTFDGKSCRSELSEPLITLVEGHGQFSHVLNGRFIGGYTTRHYGDPNNGVDAIQMELVRDLYLDDAGQFDPNRAAPLQELLYQLLKACL